MVDPSDLAGGKVLGVLPVTTAIVKYKDGHGQEATQLAIVIPGGEVYFLTKDAIDLRPAQEWMKKSINKMLGAKKAPEADKPISSSDEIPMTEDTLQV